MAAMFIEDSIRHIVWDWNGTLLDDAGACVAAINRMLAARSEPAVTLERYGEIFGFPVKDYYRRAGFDLDMEDWDALAREYHDHYAETSREAPLRDGAVETLSELRGRGVGFSVLSAAERSRLVAGLASRGIGHFFEAVYGLDDLYAESKHMLGRRLLDELGLTPATTLVVGDTIHDFEVAEALGCPCVLITAGHQAEHRLRRCGCPVYLDLRRFSAGFTK